MLHVAGVDAFRLNFSHGSHEDHARNVKTIRDIEKRTGQPITIVADMQGPKLRCGQFKGGSIELKYGETINIELGDGEGHGGHIYMPHPELMNTCVAGTILKFDDGKLQVTVLSNDGTTIKARIDVPGTLSDRKGINVINAVLPISAMTDKDRDDMAFALSQNVDFIALSFVQTKKDVTDARAIIGNKAGIIVKIEKPSAVENLDDILEQADAAMVARGDLGVELPLEQVPIVQRAIIRKCRALGKPVIVATHMLESMIDAPTPTRAEASDVATAIYQGADTVMLSAETAVGRHPATAVAIMDRIMRAVESDPEYWRYFRDVGLAYKSKPEDAISGALSGIVDILDAKAILGYTTSGATALRLSRVRPNSRILALTPHLKTARRLMLSWGLQAVVTEDPSGFDDMLKMVESIAKSSLGLSKGDIVITVAGIPFGEGGSTNTLNISTLT